MLKPSSDGEEYVLLRDDESILNSLILSSLTYDDISEDERRIGLAKRLLRHLFDLVVDNTPYPKAIFLHVLSTKTPVIKLYKSNSDKSRKFDRGIEALKIPQLNNSSSAVSSFILFRS